VACSRFWDEFSSSKTHEQSQFGTAGGAQDTETDISTRAIPLEALLRESKESALSGYVEIDFGDGGESIFLFHRGKVVTLIHRCEATIATYREALIHLWNATETMEGKVWISELPGDMAPMLRGLTDRQEIGPLVGSGSLKGLMKGGRGAVPSSRRQSLPPHPSQPSRS